jgi:transcriptional regulator with XRE-family HTH domain
MCRDADRLEMSRARKIGKKLERRRARKGVTVEELSTLTGMRVDHIRAVLAGYPNSTKRPTQLDTVHRLASALGLKLDVVAD